MHRLQARAQLVNVGAERAEVWLSAQQGVDLAQHRLGAAGLGERQVGPRELHSGLYRVVRQRGREPQPQALHPRQQLLRAGYVPTVEPDASRHAIGERGGGVLLHPGPMDDLERAVRVLLCLDPRLSSQRDGGTLAQSHHHQVRPSQLEARLDNLGEQVVGLVDLAGQPPRDREQPQCVRPELAPTGDGPDRQLRIRTHLRGPSTTELGTQEGQPRVDRGAAVRQDAFVAPPLGGIGPTLRLRRPAPGGGE